LTRVNTGFSTFKEEQDDTKHFAVVGVIDASAKASEVARGVAGVRSVKNDLTYASRSSLQ
jgi:hypothetical protein